MEAVCASEGTSARGCRWQGAGESKRERMGSRGRLTFDGNEGTGGARRRGFATSRAGTSTAEGTRTKVLGASMHRAERARSLCGDAAQGKCEIVNCGGDERKVCAV